MFRMLRRIPLPMAAPRTQQNKSRSAARLSANRAFRVRSNVDHHQKIADDLKAKVREAAGSGAGRTIKAQQNDAARNLCYPIGHWRVKAAWKGEAGCWSAAAVEEFNYRFEAWKLRSAPAPTLQDAFKALHAALANSHDPDFNKPAIDALAEIIKGFRA